ncbi:MAG: IS4 family transposase, partial [Bacteriovoracia bacterium]
EERCHPKDKSPLKWTLLTNLPIETPVQAEEIMKFYRMRWTIELYFKSLKSGCNVEKCRLDEGAKLIKFIALCGVIAWRIMWLTWLGREVPQASGELALTQVEWKVLWIKKHKDKIKAGLMKAEPPDDIPDLCTVTKLIAGLGGFMNRKGDGHPGLITITRGWMSIMETAEIYEIMAKK